MGSTEDWWYKTRLPEIQEEERKRKEIENSKNPWLASYGFGIRSFVMDYFIKLDIAKPIEDYQVGNTKYHLSIGYSF